MKYYYIKKIGGDTFKYRLYVHLETSLFTGEAYHQVVARVAECRQDEKTGKWKATSCYYYRGYKNVHCCANGREAADYYADELGLTRI